VCAPAPQFTRDRPRAERIVLDCDISAGWMHSGYPIMAYTDPGVASRLNLPNWIGRDNSWGPFHELGEAVLCLVLEAMICSAKKWPSCLLQLACIQAHPSCSFLCPDRSQPPVGCLDATKPG
jgi:hypothetical protein